MNSQAKAIVFTVIALCNVAMTNFAMAEIIRGPAGGPPICSDGQNAIFKRGTGKGGVFNQGSWICPKTKPVENVDPFGLIEATLTCTDCLNHAIIGECNWLDVRAFPPKATFHVSLKVKHFLPDFVVAVYSNESPYDGWVDGFIHDFLGFQNPGSILDSYSGNKGDDRVTTDLDYKHVDIITNPAILIYNGLASSLGLSCKSVEKIPEQPHFLSAASPSWRSPFIEQFRPESLLGFPRMSELPEYWGPLWPRTGWNSLPFDAQSALVTAQRASHILTSDSNLNALMGHVYVPPGKDCGDKCWPPPPVELGNSDNRFQMVYPRTDDDAAPLPRKGGWANGNEFDDERYAWVLWRKYQCCERKGNVYLGDITWDN